MNFQGLYIFSLKLTPWSYYRDYFVGKLFFYFRFFPHFPFQENYLYIQDALISYKILIIDKNDAIFTCFFISF